MQEIKSASASHHMKKTTPFARADVGYYLAASRWVCRAEGTVAKGEFNVTRLQINESWETWFLIFRFFHPQDRRQSDKCKENMHEGRKMRGKRV